MPPRPTLLTCLTVQEETEFLPAPLGDEIAAAYARVDTLRPEELTAESWAEQLHAHNPEVLLACWKTPPLPADLPPGLRYVCYLAGSVRKLVSSEQVAAGLIVSNWGDSISRIVAEGALLHILTGLRQTSHWAIAMHLHGGWKDPSTVTASLFGRRVGIRGFGRVARELLKLLAPFGCDIGVHAPDLTPSLASSHGIRVVPTIDALMRDHDIVVELAPLTPETHHSIRLEHLEALRPRSLFVNVGRGATVDETALLEIARRGEVFIGLDVYGIEPLPADSPFRGLTNVALTPHLGGPTTDRRVDAGRFGVRNLQAYAAGEPLRAVITPDVYASST
ncbi:hydroxyacid dehydrogenase [Actomonas aquatica]|uniref:Hydroxyacid dehydrogenase n=1 Tax=Actomonas aquatica TaxID=2866162 RepID=A0ABZ1C8Y4_9BACT|nr:hydroxyacid dehydrogenase [Opitutus sp. WL0086]WRQ87872.1 hydroxyacid dehydrogenase [Opitutus sp. WL0086]